MSLALQSILRILHIAGMAVWFGSSLFAAGDVRRSLEKGRPHVDGLPDRVRRGLRASVIAAIVTIVSGFAMIFLVFGGFKGVRPTIHAGLALSLIALVLELFWLAPTWGRIASDIEGGGSLEETKPLAKKFAAATGVLHLLRTVTMVLMIWRG